MPSLYTRRAVAVTIAAIAIAAMTVASAPAATDIAADPASAAAPIEILSNQLPASATSAAPGPLDENVAFRDLAGTPATSVDFTWLFIDANGAVVGEQRTSTRGSFAPNVAERSAGAAAHFSGYASGTSLYVADEDTNLYDPIDHVMVSVDNATFADGSSWHGTSRLADALPPAMTYDPSAAAAHIRITRIAPVRAKSLYDRVDTLLSFANDNAKRIDTIEFTYSFRDLDGNEIDRRPVVVRGAYAHGSISTLNPATRVRFKGVVMKRGSVWMGWGSKAQYVAKISVGVDAIRYADGTTWSANT